MSIVPVISRELRSQARQPLTFLLRLAGAGGIAVAFWLAFSSSRISGNVPELGPYARTTQAMRQAQLQNFGVALFGKMNFTIFVAIWLLTPLAAADSISRERREGTLPLLQLTELRAWEIVLGKSFVHIVRSSTLFLTMAPWLCVPFLFGGVSSQDLRMALLLDASALFLAQSAGLVASTLSRDWLKAVVWAYVLAYALLLGTMNLYAAILNDAFTSGSAPSAMPAFARWAGRPTGVWGQFQHGSDGFLWKHSTLLGLLTNGTMEYQTQWVMGGAGFNSMRLEFQSSWQEIGTALNPAGRALWLRGVVWIFAGSIAVFVASIFLGAACVKGSWREASGSVAWERLREKYFRPRYGVATLRKRLSRSLSRNPIGWLHQYSPSARLTKWAWCLFLVTVETILAGNVYDIYSAQFGLGLLLLLGLLFSSTGSFRDELETGAFELLLVTPIRERQILLGRVSGIWQQFLPAFVIFGAGGIFLGSGWNDDHTAGTAKQSVLWFALLFASAPFIGLYFSLLRWNFLIAWICASLTVLAVPFWLREGNTFSWGFLVIAQLCVAAFFARRVQRRLQDRLSLSPVTIER
jgi:ABC-type transport system involved in multi-copper enzyme maturation permease subunit